MSGSKRLSRVFEDAIQQARTSTIQELRSAQAALDARLLKPVHPNYDARPKIEEETLHQAHVGNDSLLCLPFADTLILQVAANPDH